MPSLCGPTLVFKKLGKRRQTRDPGPDLASCAERTGRGHSDWTGDGLLRIVCLKAGGPFLPHPVKGVDDSSLYKLRGALSSGVESEDRHQAPVIQDSVPPGFSHMLPRWSRQACTRRCCRAPAGPPSESAPPWLTLMVCELNKGHPPPSSTGVIPRHLASALFIMGSAFPIMPDFPLGQRGLTISGITSPGSTGPES